MNDYQDMFDFNMINPKQLVKSSSFLLNELNKLKIEYTNKISELKTENQKQQELFTSSQQLLNETKNQLIETKNQLIESNRSLEERISKIENEFSNLKTTNQEQANKMRQMQEKIDEQAKELERVKQIKVSEIKINSDKEFLSPGSKMKLTATTKPNNASDNDVEWKIEEENSGAVEVESQNGKVELLKLH